MVHAALVRRRRELLLLFSISRMCFGLLQYLIVRVLEAATGRQYLTLIASLARIVLNFEAGDHALFAQFQMVAVCRVCLLHRKLLQCIIY